MQANQPQRRVAWLLQYNQHALLSNQFLDDCIEDLSHVLSLLLRTYDTSFEVDSQKISAEILLRDFDYDK